MRSEIRRGCPSKTVFVTTSPILGNSSSGSKNFTVPASASTSATSPGTPGVHVRLAQPDDALCLSVLAMQVFLDTYATEGIRPQLAREVLSSYSQAVFVAALSDSGSRVCVAEHAGSLIGFAQVTLGAQHDLAPAGQQAELLRLYVQEPFTGKKVGTLLLARAERLALEGGASVLWLTPWVHNHRALAFYLRRGYEDFGLTYFVLEGESHENRVHAKHLRAASAA